MINIIWLGNGEYRNDKKGRGKKHSVYYLGMIRSKTAAVIAGICLCIILLSVFSCCSANPAPETSEPSRSLTIEEGTPTAETAVSVLTSPTPSDLSGDASETQTSDDVTGSLYRAGSYSSFPDKTIKDNDTKAPSEKRFEFEGVEYTGKYSITLSSAGNYEVVDSYDCSANEEDPESPAGHYNQIIGYFDRFTGKMYGVFFSTHNEIPTEEWREKDLERAREIASSFAGDELD